MSRAPRHGLADNPYSFNIKDEYEDYDYEEGELPDLETQERGPRVRATNTWKVCVRL